MHGGGEATGGFLKGWGFPKWGSHGNPDSRPDRYQKRYRKGYARGGVVNHAGEESLNPDRDSLLRVVIGPNIQCDGLRT